MHRVRSPSGPRLLLALAVISCGACMAGPRGGLREGIPEERTARAIADLRRENTAVDQVLEDSDGIAEGLTKSLLTIGQPQPSQNQPLVLESTIDSIDASVGKTDSSQRGMWKTISVWVEPSDVIPKGPAFHSQVGQDQSIVAAFNGRSGYFVDLAANDPVALSNTLALERDFGWTGICIEANPQYWARLAHRQCQVFGAVVGKNDEDQLDVALDQRGVYGGIVGPQFDNKQKTSESKRRSVTLETILRRASAPNIIDYFSLDVEGAEEFIMKDFPFGSYRFNLLTVERPSEFLQDLLINNSYIYVRDHGKFGDQMWRHATFST